MSSVFVVVSLSCLSHGFRCTYLFYLAFDVLPNPLLTVHIITKAHNNYLNHVHLTIHAQYTASRQLNTSYCKVIRNKITTMTLLSALLSSHIFHCCTSVRQQCISNAIVAALSCNVRSCIFRATIV